MTLTEKILCHHAVGLSRPWVQAGDTLRIKADWTIASELAWNGMNTTYDKIGRPPIHDRERFYLAIDHTVDPGTLKNDKRTQKLVQLSRSFAKEAGLRQFFDANETILHTKFYRDLVQPGETVIGADSHTSSHGGIGAFAIGLGGADVCIAMVLGETWIQVPEAIQVIYDGSLPYGLTGKDVILKTLGTLGRNTVAMERSVEYVGPALANFSSDFRFTVANMTAEFGGLNGIFPADEQIADVLARRKSHNDSPLYFRADEDATYAARHTFDLAKLVPQVAKPFSPDNVFDVDEFVGTEMQGMFIGACTTTEEELILGALVLRPGGAGLAGDHGQPQGEGPAGGLRAGRLPRGPAGLLHVPRHRLRQGGRGRELALQPEPQLPQPDGSGLAGVAGVRGHGGGQRAGDEDRGSAAHPGAHPGGSVPLAPGSIGGAAVRDPLGAFGRRGRGARRRGGRRGRHGPRHGHRGEGPGVRGSRGHGRHHPR
jgi:homoaconitase/3-isopropylmalate dehydratase large subunit